MKKQKVGMSNEIKHSNDDVVIMFPSRIVSDLKVETTNPVHTLANEIQDVSRDYIALPDFNDFSDLQTISQVTDSLEIRLNVLEEVQSRLKFYLDDIENSTYLPK